MNFRTKPKIDKVLAEEAKLANKTTDDGFTRVIRRNKKQEKFIWERDVCDAESIITCADENRTPAPRLKTFEDGAFGYQFLSAGKLAEAMAMW